MSTDYSEDALVEQPAIALFNQLGYETANCFYERVGSSGSTLGRETTEQVILFTRLRAALHKLNPDLESIAIELAIDELARDRNAMSPAQANREVYKLLKDGVKVAFQNTEGEQGVISLETLIRGTCEKNRLIDLIENFTLFDEARSGLVKITGKNHQFLGVNNAVEALEQIKANQGKLGVFWHTQGSGKSFSMAFFSQKVLRKLTGNWTFVVITDRNDLDKQIYKTFASTSSRSRMEQRFHCTTRIASRNCSSRMRISTMTWMH